MTYYQTPYKIGDTVQYIGKDNIRHEGKIIESVGSLAVEGVDGIYPLEIIEK